MLCAYLIMAISICHLLSLSKLDHTQFICQMIKFKRPIKKFYYKILNANTTQKKK